MSAILGLVAAGFKLVSGWLGFRRDEQLRQTGRLEQKTADQQAAIDGQRRMEEAAAKPRESSEDALDAGKF